MADKPVYVANAAEKRRHEIAILAQSQQTLANMAAIPKGIKARLDKLPFKTVSESRAYEECQRQIQALEIGVQAILDEMQRRVTAAQEAEIKEHLDGNARKN